MHQVIQRCVKQHLTETNSGITTRIADATIALAHDACDKSSFRKSPGSFVGSCTQSAGFLHQEFLPQPKWRHLPYSVSTWNACVLDAELALQSLVTSASKTGLSLSCAYRCCMALTFSMDYRNASEVITSWQLTQSCLAKYSTEGKLKDRSSRFALYDKDNSLEAYWYSLSPTELYRDVIERLFVDRVNRTAKNKMLCYAAFHLRQQNANWHLIKLLSILDVTLPDLLQEIRETKSALCVGIVFNFSSALCGVGEFVHSESALYDVIKLCIDVSVPMWYHAEHFFSTIDLFCIAISELGQSERALAWWDISYTVIMGACMNQPPSSAMIKLCHNSLRCCHQSCLGCKIKEQVQIWLWRIVFHESSAELLHLDKVLVQEAFRHAYQYFVNCQEEKCPAAQYLKERLSGYFVKLHAFSSACTPLRKPDTEQEAHTNNMGHDPLEPKRTLLRVCRAVASSNVLPHSAEGISLMIDTFYAKYARHGNMVDYMKQMMSSPTLHHVFREFLAASGDDDSDVHDAKLPDDITTITPAAVLDTVSHILRSRGKETCASAVDSFLNNSHKSIR